MGYETGHLKGMSIGGTDVAGFLDGSVDIEITQVEQLATSDTWPTIVPTTAKGSGSFRYLLDESDSKQDDLRAAAISVGSAATIASVKFEVSYGSATMGSLDGTIVISKVSTSNPGVGGNIEQSVDFTFSGAVTETAKSDS